MLDGLSDDALRRSSGHSVDITFSDIQLNGMYRFLPYCTQVVGLCEPFEDEVSAKLESAKGLRGAVSRLLTFAVSSIVAVEDTLGEQKLDTTSPALWCSLVDSVAMVNILEGLRHVDVSEFGDNTRSELEAYATLMRRDVARLLDLCGRVSDMDERANVDVSAYATRDLSSVEQTLASGMGVFWMEYLRNQGMVATAVQGKDFEQLCQEYGARRMGLLITTPAEEAEMRVLFTAIAEAFDKLQNESYKASVAVHEADEFEFSEEVLNIPIAGLIAPILARRRYDAASQLSGWCRVCLTSPARCLWVG